MKKIMFSDKFYLTAAVLAGTKTQTRRIVPQSIVDELYYAGFYGDFTDDLKQILIKNKSRYKVGEVVTVAQNYNEVYSYYRQHNENVCAVMNGRFGQFHKGWTNKMFVESLFMPHKIEITNIRVERLQDISDEDCIAEGIMRFPDRFTGDIVYSFQGCGYNFDYPITAYSELIDSISGKGTFERNPWVFAYNFKLIK